MSSPKQNEYGSTILYEVGDRVRVWQVFKRPVGTIVGIVDSESFIVKYAVQYQYVDGATYTEEFESNHLTLFERKWSFHCNCETVSGRHTSWCNNSTR